MKFTHYKVPKIALLDKFFKITDEGEYYSTIEDKNKRFAFILSSISFGRILMGAGCSVTLTS
jgi:acyl-CoA oxidase